MARARAGRVARVIGPVLANPELRRIELAFAGFNSAEWAVWIAMLVYAFGRGGTLAAGLVALAQLIPSALSAPFAATLADRRAPARVLTFGYVVQAGAMGATALVLILSGPPLLAYALAAAAASGVTITRPTQAVLIPALVHGAGGVLGIAVTVRLIGRARLAPPLAGAAVVWAAAFAALALTSGVIGAFALLAIAGGARTLLDVTVRTLLQRTAHADALAGVFGLLEALDSVGLALGSVLAPALVALLGARAAIAGLAVILLAMLLITGRRLRSIDAHANVPVVEVALLRSLPIFAALGPPVLEGLARASSPVEIAPGDCVIREGEQGDRYYAIVDGTLAVSNRSGPLGTVGRGEGVGEVALLAGVPRTATVIAQTPARLLAIDAEQFIEVVTAHPASARVGAELVGRRLPASPTRH
jgi:Cyclic nucleotide-binding domain